MPASSLSAAEAAAPAVSPTRPVRVRLSRAKGWRLPADAVKVDRTTRWGNPYTVADCGSVEVAVARYAQWLRGELVAPDGRMPPTEDAIRRALRGRSLACWCALDGPCHADRLLAIANAASADDEAAHG